MGVLQCGGVEIVGEYWCGGVSLLGSCLKQGLRWLPGLNFIAF